MNLVYLGLESKKETSHFSLILFIVRNFSGMEWSQKKNKQNVMTQWTKLSENFLFVKKKKKNIIFETTQTKLRPQAAKENQKVNIVELSLILC